jgi:rubrerythrin
MNKEYIEREALLEEINDAISNMAFVSPYQDEIDSITNGAEQIRDMVAEALAADVEPVRHGEWIPIITPFTTNRRVSRWRCSECREVVYNKQGNYCPKCGTKMNRGNK